MKLKLDENLGHRTLAILHGAGHDVTTVAQQKISGISDLELIDLCKSESRALVTLDLDFALLLRAGGVIVTILISPASYLTKISNKRRGISDEKERSCASRTVSAVSG